MDCLFAAHIKANQIIPQPMCTNRLYQKTGLWSVSCVCAFVRPRFGRRSHPLFSEHTDHSIQLRDNLRLQTKRIQFSFCCHLFRSYTLSLFLNSVFQISLLQKSMSFLICLSWCASHFLNPTVCLSLNGLAKGVCMQRRVNQTSLILIYSYPSVCLSVLFLLPFISRL